MAAASSAPVMLTQVSITSYDGRAMAGGDLGGRGDATTRRVGRQGTGAERSREAADSCVSTRVVANVMLSYLLYCSPLVGHGPQAAIGGPRENDKRWK
jgi:hypothetical protein